MQFLAGTRFACLECSAGYFLQPGTGLCAAHVTADELCEEMESNSTRCRKCKQEAFLMRVEGTCVLSPNREKNCVKYNEMGLCLECSNNTFPETVILDANGDRLGQSDRYTPGMNA